VSVAPRSPEDAETVREAARVHAVFREVNERIHDLNEAFDLVLEKGEWFCECADPGCTERLEMTLAEYEAIRRHPERFPVIPGHEDRDAKRALHVVSRHSSYLIVEELQT
jgi:hypothetical protein